MTSRRKRTRPDKRESAWLIQRDSGDAAPELDELVSEQDEAPERVYELRQMEQQGVQG